MREATVNDLAQHLKSETKRLRELAYWLRWQTGKHPDALAADPDAVLMLVLLPITASAAGRLAKRLNPRPARRNGRK
jgi:hypothetical protein